MSPHDLERVRAYIDGELDAGASAALLREAQANPELQRELDGQQSLHSLLRGLPPVAAPPARPLRPWWAAWLPWSGPITLRPAALAFGAAGLFFLGVGVDRLTGAGTREVSAPVEVAKAETVPVRFVFVGQATKVAVAGSFNQWNETANPMQSAGDGMWEATVQVPKGEHRYQFRVDGKWIADPLAEQQAPDGMGQVDSVIRL